MEGKYNITCDVFKYNTLKDAIPKEWRKTLQSMKIPPEAISFQEALTLQVNKNPQNIAAVTNKDVYWILIKNKQKNRILLNVLGMTSNYPNHNGKKYFVSRKQ